MRTARTSTIHPWLALAVVVSSGCASRASTMTELPAIPHRTGTLAIDVVYPPFASTISAVDSNFIFGSVGHGDAGLTINGTSVTVEANGSFLAWLPLPPSQGDSIEYDLVATLGERRVRHAHRLHVVDPAPEPPPDSTFIDEDRLVPRGVWWVREGERVRIEARATPGASVRLLMPDGEVLSLSSTPGSTLYGAQLTVVEPLGRGQKTAYPPPVPADPLAVADACSPLPELDDAGEEGTDGRRAEAMFGARCGVVEAAFRGDTVRAALPLDLWVLTETPQVELDEAPATFGRDRLVPAEADHSGTIVWLWASGGRSAVVERRNDRVKLRLDSSSEAWVSLRDLRWPMVTAPLMPARVGSTRINPLPGRVSVRVPVERPALYAVSIDDRRLSFTLYDAVATGGTISLGAADPFLRAAWWEQPARDRFVLHIDLSRRPWGYRVAYEDGVIVLHIRRPPEIDPERPLAGRIVAIDPGHPPAGATGPTRLYEGDVNLAIAAYIKRMLEREGARVVLPRTDRGSVRLYDRVDLAEALEADVIVSIHNNALPDGVNPFPSHGTSVYYFHTHEADLAEALQRQLLATMRLRDLGVFRGSLALARPTWLPSALTEGAFMMIPEQEAALRDPGFIQAYARGVVEGLREFFAGRAR